MRRRLVIKKRLQHRRLSELRTAKQAEGASKSITYNFRLNSAGLINPIMA